MALKTKRFFIVLAALLFFIPDVFSVPSPGGKGRIGSYNSPLQHSRITSNVTFPYPSNKWYGSIFTTHGTHSYSFRMSASPWLVNLNTNSPNTAEGNGYVLGYPAVTSSVDTVSNDYNPQFVARISGRKQPSNNEIMSSGSLLDGYSDWSSTFIVRDSTDSTKWIKTTIGKGFIFTYNEYSAELNPYIYFSAQYAAVYDASGTVISPGTARTLDRIMIKTPADANGRVVYYAVYAPENTSFTVDSNSMFVSAEFASAERYLSAALITAGESSDASLHGNALAIFNDYYQYAYNFVTDTKVSYVFNQNDSKVVTTFAFSTEAKRSGAGFASGTVFALFPHQWKNSSAALKPGMYDFNTIRGRLRVAAGLSFTTENQFYGILPNLTYEVPAASRNILLDHMTNEYNSLNLTYSPGTGGGDVANNTYVVGKALARAANLIPIFHQSGNVSGRNSIIERLKTELQTWYTYSGQTAKYFGYDSNWGGLIGVPVAFGSENYTDHHFHYGYFIYASAILALFDPAFAGSDEYKGMVNLLVKNIYNPDSSDAYFTFLRHFDVYEGHSWANGFGGRDDRGIDQESSSEAMNAWAGIYLWGLASNDRALMDLGAYGYSTEYEATKEYFLDKSGEIYGGTAYGYKGVGILYDNQSEYSLHFTPIISQTVKGIQVLPLTPSMLYHGYDTSYARAYYEEMLANADPAYAALWKDIWLRYKSLYDAPGALDEFEAGGFTAEAGSSLTYSYQFINFFNAYGTVDTTVYADNESFCIMDKGGQKSYIAFNASPSSYKNVNFKTVSGGSSAGRVNVPPMTTVVTSDFLNFKYDSLRTMHSEGNNYILLADKYSESISASPFAVPAIDQTYYITVPFAFVLDAPAGYLDRVKGYVRLSDIQIPSGYGADQIKLAVYNSGTSLPERVYPEQSISVESESGGTASVLIEATLTRTGAYVLVIPTGVVPPGSSIISGAIKNARDNSDVGVQMRIYNSSNSSEITEIFTGFYEIDVIEGVSYVITPVNDAFAFEPESFSFTGSGTDLVQDFTALPKLNVSGKILFNMRGLNNIKIGIYERGGGTETVKSSSDGSYSGSMYYGRTYTVEPVSSEYDFIPTSVTFDNVVQSYPNMDFFAQIASGRFVVYPNPYKPSKHGNTGITFTGLKAGAEIKIYNIAGELVFDAKVPADGPYIWYAENNYGYQAGSGVYIYYIKTGGKVLKGKVAVER